MSVNLCLFCLWETDFNLAPGESTTCPICGVDVLAFSTLLSTEHFWSQIKEQIPNIDSVQQNWETRITADENHFLVFVWNTEEALPTSQVAEILGHSDVRAVSYLVRNEFLPNTKGIQKGEKSVRYFIPRKDIVNHMNRKSKAQKQPLE